MVLDFSVYVLILYNDSRPVFVHILSLIAGFVWVGLYRERLRSIAYRILRGKFLDADNWCDIGMLASLYLLSMDVDFLGHSFFFWTC